VAAASPTTVTSSRRGLFPAGAGASPSSFLRAAAAVPLYSRYSNAASSIPVTTASAPTSGFTAPRNGGTTAARVSRCLRSARVTAPAAWRIDSAVAFSGLPSPATMTRRNDRFFAPAPDGPRVSTMSNTTSRALPRATPLANSRPTAAASSADSPGGASGAAPSVANTTTASASAGGLSLTWIETSVLVGIIEWVPPGGRAR
jgi:hypothetical protein